MTAIITRQQAKDQHLSRYFTGKLCTNGHISERNTKNGHCIECDRTRSEKFRSEHPEVMQKWREQNPEYASNKYHENKEERLQQSKEWYETNKDRCLERRKQWYYRDDTQAKLREWRKQWYIANPEYDREYYYNNHERMLTTIKPKLRQAYNQKQRRIKQQKFQELAQMHVLPEVPTEHDFKYWFAGEIIKRTGWVVNKEVVIGDGSRIDLLIPEAKLGIELKLSTHNWVKSVVVDQRDRYQQLLEDQGYMVLIVTLDGSIGQSAAAFLDSINERQHF